jgi:hypothetical protein
MAPTAAAVRAGGVRRFTLPVSLAVAPHCCCEPSLDPNSVLVTVLCHTVSAGVWLIAVAELKTVRLASTSALPAAHAVVLPCNTDTAAAAAAAALAASTSDIVSE